MKVLVLTTQAAAAIYRLAEEQYPLECCGILVGIGTCVAYAIGARNVAPARPHERFVIDPRGQLAAERFAQASSMEVIGFFHSHPDHGAQPSAIDLAEAWPVYSYVIVSVTRDGPGKMTAWILDEAAHAFVEQQVVIG